MSSTTKVSNAMYTKAKKVLGYWTIMLESSPVGPVQFKSLSRKLANEWRTLNEPIPAPNQYNASLGADVWRAR